MRGAGLDGEARQGAARPEPPAWRREITTISFDMDGTLVDFAAAMRSALAWVLAEIHRAVPETPEWLTVPALMAIRDGMTEAHPQERHDVTRRMAIAHALELIGHPDPDLVTYLTEGYRVRRLAATYLYPDTQETLVALGRRYTLGITSNGNSDPRHYGLGPHFSFVVFSEDHGVSKPDPRLFAIALREAHCHSHECLHVGDLAWADVAGAQAAGLRAAWLRRGDAPSETPPADLPPPDLTIDRLTELVDLLCPDA